MKKNEINQNINMLDESFHRILNKMMIIEKTPRTFGSEFLLYPSEIHTIEAIGKNPGLNITELARKQGVTKGAVSQTISKLVKKGFVIKMKDVNNDRGVFLKLSKPGEKAFAAHEAFHSTVHSPLTEFVANASRENLDFVNQLFSLIESFCDNVLDTK